MAAPAFDDDLFDFTGAALSEDESAGGASLADGDHDDAGAANEVPGDAGEEAPSPAPARRKRGSRGGSSSGAQSSEKRWRSGAIPQAPGFDGDVERNPYCLRHYRRRLMRWVRITRDFLPPGEQALRALEQLSGEAELEFEEVADDRFDNEQGIQRLLSDLESAFGEREMFRQGGVIREFENIGRLQGESVTAFVRRFQLLERKLQDSRVPSYPEAARTVKLLDGLKLDERSTASLLLAAGNKYQMKPILEAIRIQYPPGMTITGVPRGLSTLGSRTSRASSSRASSYRSSSTAVTRSAGRSGRTRKWSQWNTDWQDGIPEGEEDEPENEETQEAYQGEEIDEYEPNEEPDYQDDEEEELVPETENVAPAGDDGEVSALIAAAEALTVTSRKLAGLVQSRGYYQSGDGKGKGKPPGDKGKGKSSRAKGKGRGKSQGKSTDKGKNSSKGKNSGKGGNSAERQQRLRGSLCMGCGAADHWIRDCPNVSMHQAHIATADVQLDPEGIPVSETWMTLVTDSDSETENIIEYQVPRPPSIMLSSCDDASYLIADTGCQRQVAGCKWHVQRQHELQLVPMKSPEVCRFSFGPNKGVPSMGRWLYPAGIAGELVMLGVSEVNVDAPGLLSRPAMEALGAVPDLLEGRITFKALGGKSTKLYLSPCRHLALKIDEWPEGECDVQAVQNSVKLGKQGLPDVAHPNAYPPERVRLEVIGNSRVAKAPPDALQEQIRTSSMAPSLARSSAAMAASSGLQLNKYPRDASRCDHTGGAGTRVYGAAGIRIRICDNCGSRWVLTPAGDAMEVAPKANPNAKTPLGLTDAQRQRVVPPKAKASSTTASRANVGPSAKSSQPSSGYWQGPSLGTVSMAKAPPPPPSTNTMIPSRTPALFRLSGQRRMPHRQWHASTPASSDTDAMSVTSRRSRTEDGTQPAWQRVQYTDGTYMTQAEVDEILMSQNNDINLQEERMARDDWAEDQIDDLPAEMRRAPPIYLWDLTIVAVYKARTQASRLLRRHGTDLLEIYEGDTTISEAAVAAGLRVVQPLSLWTVKQANLKHLEKMLLKRLPYVIVWRRGGETVNEHEPPNVSESETAVLQLILNLYNEGVHFVIGCSGQSEFWEAPCNKKLRGLPGVHLVRTKQRGTWLSSLEIMIQPVEACDQLTLSTTTAEIVNGIWHRLALAGDERWGRHTEEVTSLPGSSQAWTSGINRDDVSEEFMLMWEPPGEIEHDVWFLDINRHQESWRPLLQEAEKRLRGLTTSSVTLKASPFMEQVKALVPWDIKKVQLFRAPKQRRLPQDVLNEGWQHRGAALMYNNETIALEAEAISTIINSPTGKYSTPVRIGIYFYGNAPATSLNPEENQQPEAAKKTNDAVVLPDKEDQMLPGHPGYKDINFPGSDAPTWVHQVLRRMHTNLGHPPKEVLVRQLVTAGASETAVRAARHLRCETCLRVSPPYQPRTTKAVQARRFNDRVCMDIVYVKDIRGGPHMFLNLVDDGTVYQAVTRLVNRSEESVVTALVNGWFTYFGPPDELAIDAEGAFRGMRFEMLNAQLNISVRCVPPDSHWQLGKAERHGQALKYNVARLIHQFAALTPAEVNVCVLMACYAKNRLVRRSGSSPNQWVFGRDPKLPASLLSDGGSIESAQLTSDSDRLMQLEAIRTEALMNHHRYEAHESLRAALLRNSRPYRGTFEPGQKVAYFRKSTQTGDGEGSIEGYRQGIVLALDRNPSSNVVANIWIRNSRGRIVQCSPEQCRPIAGEQEWWVPDAQDLEVLKNCDEDLRIHPRAFRVPDDRPSPADDKRLLDKAAEKDGETKATDAFDLGSPVPATPVAPGTPSLLAPRPAPFLLDEQDRILPLAHREHGRDRGLSPERRLRREYQIVLNHSNRIHADFATVWSFAERDTARGIKRPSDVAVGELGCGEQYRVFPKECPRCGSVHSVSNPLDVVSWLDEVKEREAFDQIVGVPLRRDEFVPPDEKTNEIDYYQTPPSTLLSTTTISRPGMHRLDVLRRHGRGGHLRHGWDGSPSEVQLFHSDAFLTAAHLAGADQPETPELQVQDHQALLSSSRPTSSTTSLSEGLAKILLKRKDFDHDSCHQLLEVVKLRKPGRQCLSSNRARSGTLTLGYYSHGKQLGFTNDTMHHKHLARYLGRYLRHHGMKGDISSLFIACNVHSDLWVEAEAHDCKYHLMQERRVHGRRKLGYLLDTRRRLQSFYPHLYHGSDDFTGNRFVITAYQTRLVDKAPEEHLSILREMGFRSKRTAASADVLNTDAAAKAPEETFREYVTVLEAYPVKEQSSSAGDTERVVALESSSEEEGHDGSFETRRAELQARKKEIHWRSLTEEEVPCFVEAVQKEWSEWQRWSSCKAVQVREGEVPSHLILKSRLCYRWKPVPEGQRAKARIVIAGFRDPHLAILTRDAPVLAREPDTERPEQIFMRAPADPIALQANPEWRCKTLLYKLSAPVYGQSNAPRRWYDHFSKVMRKLGWTQHSLDPCLFLWRVGSQIGAVLGLHVDDLIAAALTEYEEVLNKVEASFTWGSPWVSEEFTFIGRKVKQHPDGSVTIDQSTYVGDIPTTKVKLPEDTLLSLHPSLVTEFRSGIGSLQWLSSTTRGDVAADMADLREVNSVLRYVKATPEAMVRIVHVPLESLIFVAYGDSGFANAPNNKSQGGLVIVATDRCALREPCEASLLEWKSYRHQRVLRSTLAAEASALDRSHDHARFMAMVFSEMVYGDYIATVNERAKHEVVPVTDARSLWDAVHRLSTSFTEKRVEIDVAALRQTCQGLRWVPTEQMHADCMTKRSRSLRDDFRQWMAQPMVTLVDSKSSKDVAVGSEANVAWRKD
ncbi:GIP [Symbiodinium sp. CCMP2592]|nr:GIP [Symbiodinium sp. CCMP2592]